jgi:peptidyl-dipeptidase A
MKRVVLIFFILLLAFIGCSKSGELQKEVQAYLDEYTQEFQRLYYNWSEGEWALNTKIVEGDRLTSLRAAEAQEEYARFTGSTENIERARKYLEHKDQLTDLQVRQLNRILYLAAKNPETVSDLVVEKIAADTRQTELLYGFDFKLNGKSISTNEIDELLKTENNLNKRLKIWETSKEVGKGLKDGLSDLQRLRNQTVQALGYDDFFTYEVSDYGMTVEEMRELSSEMMNDVWPLYRELHTWARYTLAERYNAEVPELLPAHWLPNRWGQNWQGIITTEEINLDEKLKEYSAEWIVEKGEEFYVSLGFEKLPQSFYEKSSLYPVPPDAGYKKNNHASAWHMDLENDLRSLMSVIPNTRWWETTLHELGHIYYFMSYTNPDVPPL